MPGINRYGLKVGGSFSRDLYTRYAELCCEAGPDSQCFNDSYLCGVKILKAEAVAQQEATYKRLQPAMAQKLQEGGAEGLVDYLRGHGFLVPEGGLWGASSDRAAQRKAHRFSILKREDREKLDVDKRDPRDWIRSRHFFLAPFARFAGYVGGAVPVRFSTT